MTTDAKKRFTVITNENFKNATNNVVTNPISYQAQDLREQLAKFRNNESGARFTVEDLLKW